jgi:hypothetical protein
MSDKKEPVRHIDKTRQDHQPVADRQRVKEWHKRIQTREAEAQMRKDKA